MCIINTSMVNSWITVAGKLLPAIGFAMILTVMAKVELIPFVLIGYSCSILKLPVIGIAFLGLRLHYLKFFRTQNSKGSNSTRRRI